MSFNHGMPAHKVRSQAQLDCIEADWRGTMGTGSVNRAVRIVRTPNRLRITTETGNIILFECGE